MYLYLCELDWYIIEDPVEMVVAEHGLTVYCSSCCLVLVKVLGHILEDPAKYLAGPKMQPWG